MFDGGHAYTDRGTDTGTDILAEVQTQAHAQTHAHTHTQTHTGTRTGTRTHTLPHQNSHKPDGHEVVAVKVVDVVARDINLLIRGVEQVRKRIRICGDVWCALQVHASDLRKGLVKVEQAHGLELCSAGLNHGRPPEHAHHTAATLP